MDVKRVFGPLRRACMLLALAALCACSGGGGTAVSSTLPAMPGVSVERVCAEPAVGDDVRCFAQARTDANAHFGYGPQDLQAAYALPSARHGVGQTIAVIDAYDDPNAESDLAVYRAHYGLPACTTDNGCFRKVNQVGRTYLPQPDGAWSQETSLDLDMVSAICPKCHILLVEAISATTPNLATAVNTAVDLHANVISNSYGTSELGASMSAYDHPGHVIVASSGDQGAGTMQPCAFASVVCVGGTTLTRASTARGWNETPWSAAGYGCSAYVQKPQWQNDGLCSTRSESDVAAVADPATGVAVYDSFAFHGRSGWQVFGGTSVSAPLVAGVYALAGNASTLRYAAQRVWENPATLNAVTLPNGNTGYSGASGLGTPNGVAAF